MSFRPLSLVSSSWLVAVTLLFTLAPAARATTTTATLPIALQGNYTISSVSLGGTSVSLPSAAKKYTLKLGAKGLTAVNATTLGTIFKDFSFGSLLKVTVTSTTPTVLKGTLSGKIAYSGLSLTVADTTIKAIVASPGVLTISGTVNASAKIVIFGFSYSYPYSFGLTITLKKQTPVPAKS